MAPKSIPIYLYSGPEIEEKNAAIASLLKTIKTSCGEDPEIVKLYPHDSNIDDWYGELQNGSLFAAHRLFHFQRVDEFSAQEIKTIVLGIETLPEETTLLFTTLKTQAPNGIDKLVPSQQKKVFWELYENQKQQWIERYVEKEKKSITSEAIDTILNVVENNKKDLRETCDKLLAFTRTEQEITEYHVETFIYHSKEENVFTLFHAIIHRDLEGALKILHTLALSGEASPSALLPGLLWQFRRLLSLASLEEQGTPLSEAYMKVKILGKGSPIRGTRNQKTYKEGITNFSPSELQQCITQLATCEEQSRTLRSDQHTLLLELFLYEVIQKKGKGLATYQGFQPRPIGV